MHTLDDEDVAATFQGLTSRVALQGTYLVDEDELLVGRPCDVMHIWMVVVHDFATGKADIAGILWCHTRVWPSGTKQGLGKTPGQQCFADVLRTGEQVGMAHALGDQCAA